MGHNIFYILIMIILFEVDLKTKIILSIKWKSNAYIFQENMKFSKTKAKKGVKYNKTIFYI